MKIINNIGERLVDDLKVEMTPGSKVSIAAACFSVYAFEELKAQLEKVEQLRFIFTSPTFLAEPFGKERREFYIPRLDREKALHGNEFEIKLRNEFTQRAIARECAEWIKKKVIFKSNTTGETMQGFLAVETDDSRAAYTPISGFTRADLGCERGGNMYSLISKFDAPESKAFLDVFDSVWGNKTQMEEVTEAVLKSITTAYKENSPEFLYFFALYNIFGEFLENVNEDELPNEGVGLKDSQIWKMLYAFQKDAALAIISKLEKYNGCILADSVGLGKTFTALAVIKYYEQRNMRVLVLCPKKLSDNWVTYKANYINNPIAGDRLRYDVLFHTDLSRSSGRSGEIDLERINWGAYDLVVIDESHNFRNGGETSDDGRMNRYNLLMERVIRAGARTRVLMLSATPVNNRFYDLRNQLALAYEGNSEAWKDKLSTDRSVEEIFRNAQKVFNAWSKRDAESRSTDQLLRMLDFDFFEILDSVTIARSRKHIEKYYDVDEVGKFPERLPPISKRPPLTDLSDVTYDEIYDRLISLTLSIYTPSNYILPSRIEKYAELNHEGKNRLTQVGREQGIRRLMSINLLKRLESSVHSFRLTVQRIQGLIGHTLDTIARYDPSLKLDLVDFTDVQDFDPDDLESDLFSVGKKVKIALEDMDYKTWQHHLQEDYDTLVNLLKMVESITPEHDSKLKMLLDVIGEKMVHPVNAGNKKVIVFTAFSDTAEYLYEQVSQYAKEHFGVNTALITGSVDGRTTIPRFQATFNNVLTHFSPISKDRDAIDKDGPDIDILIATDCISEGQNLQDCDCLINYDIHWNPVRLVQRFGRIDRIGSQNEKIQMINFWPDMKLDDYINLKARVETRMKVVVLTSTGDDNMLSPEEQGDLEYRRKQLERLQTEVVDIEEMSGGVAITDLGLNEFRMELMEYAKHHPELEKCPGGISAVAAATKDAPAGVIFVLKNVHNEVNIDNRNRLHPYYLVYLDNDGMTIRDHLSPRDILENMRMLCRGKDKPIEGLYQQFNRETDDGRDMDEMSLLLRDAINSIVDIEEEQDIESLFHPGGTTIGNKTITGLEDFELVAFLVVR